MREITLTKGYVALVDDDRYDELSSVKWTASVHKNRKGEISIVYAYRWTSAKDGPKRMVTMHRQVAGVYETEIDVDHEDHNGLNNTRDNLRIGDATLNLGNQRVGCDNTSGYKGVSWYKAYKMWRVKIQFRRKTIHVGYFRNIEDAAAAYKEKAEELYGEFSCTDGSTTRREAA